MYKLFSFFLSQDKLVLDNRTSFGLLLMRVSLGLIMAFSHGWEKLDNFTEMSTKFADPIGLGMTLSLALTIFAEYFCSIAIALGFLTRAALVPLIITMVVAVLIVHGDDSFGKQEFGLLYLIPYMTLFLTGPGKYSLDHRLFGSK